MKKILVIGIVLLFILMSITLSSAVDNVKKSIMSISDGNTLYVGGSGEDNYTKIQDAIDDAVDGDTVFVYEGIYYEHLRIDKDINVFGQDKEKTVIDAGGIETAVEIGANVNLSGFTIQNAEEGISNFYPPPPDNIYNFYVYGNIIKNNVVGLALGGTQKSVIHHNIISYNQLGINFFYADESDRSDCHPKRHRPHATSSHKSATRWVPFDRRHATSLPKLLAQKSQPSQRTSSLHSWSPDSASSFWGCSHYPFDYPPLSSYQPRTVAL